VSSLKEARKKPGHKPGFLRAARPPMGREHPRLRPFSHPAFQTPFRITINHPDCLTWFSHVKTQNQSNSYQGQAQNHQFHGFPHKVSGKCRQMGRRSVAKSSSVSAHACLLACAHHHDGHSYSQIALPSKLPAIKDLMPLSCSRIMTSGTARCRPISAYGRRPTMSGKFSALRPARSRHRRLACQHRCRSATPESRPGFQFRPRQDATAG